MKRLTGFILALVMIAALVSGCSSSPPASSSSTSSGSSSAAASTSGSDEKVTWDSNSLSWKQDTSPVTYSLFLDISWAPMDVWGTDHVSQKVTELTGVSFDVTKAQDSSHLDMLMASGSYPDAIFVYRNKHKYENPNVSQPWNELIPEYVPEFTDLIDPSAIEAATKDDGNFYTLYTHFRDESYWEDPDLPVSYGEPDLMFRDDVMEAIGSPKMESIDDFYNALKLVKEKYADYTPYLETSLNNSALKNWMGIEFEYSDFKVDESGKLYMPLRNQEQMKEYLSFKNKLVREGLMSVEGLTYDFEKQKQAVLAGKVFSTAAQIYDVDIFNSGLNDAGSDLRYTALDTPLTYDGSVQYAPVYASAGFAGLYITTACKEPGRLIRLMEFMRSPEGDRLTQWGVEGADYTLNADNLPVINNDIEWKVRGDNVWYFGASFMVETEKAMVPANPEFSQVTNLMYAFKKYWSSDTSLSKCEPLPETEESETKTSIQTLWTNNCNIIVTARDDAEFEQRFKTFYDDLERLDLDGYISWAQEIYDNAKDK